MGGQVKFLLGVLGEVFPNGQRGPSAREHFRRDRKKVDVAFRGHSLSTTTAGTPPPAIPFRQVSCYAKAFLDL